MPKNIKMENKQYKLALTFTFFTTRPQTEKVTRCFVWDNKEDALACKELMHKSITHSEITMKFTEFVELKVNNFRGENNGKDDRSKS